MKFFKPKLRWSTHKFASRDELQASVNERNEKRRNHAYKAPFTFKRKWKVDPQWREATPHQIINKTIFAQIKVNLYRKTFINFKLQR